MGVFKTGLHIVFVSMLLGAVSCKAPYEESDVEFVTWSKQGGYAVGLEIRDEKFPANQKSQGEFFPDNLNLSSGKKVPFSADRYLGRNPNKTVEGFTEKKAFDILRKNRDGSFLIKVVGMDGAKDLTPADFKVKVKFGSPLSFAENDNPKALRARCSEAVGAGFKPVEIQVSQGEGDYLPYYFCQGHSSEPKYNGQTMYVGMISSAKRIFEDMEFPKFGEFLPQDEYRKFFYDALEVDVLIGPRPIVAPRRVSGVFVANRSGDRGIFVDLNHWRKVQGIGQSLLIEEKPVKDSESYVPIDVIPPVVSDALSPGSGDSTPVTGELLAPEMIWTKVNMSGFKDDSGKGSEYIRVEKQGQGATMYIERVNPRSSRVVELRPRNEAARLSLALGPKFGLLKSDAAPRYSLTSGATFNVLYGEIDGMEVEVILGINSVLGVRYAKGQDSSSGVTVPITEEQFVKELTDLIYAL